MKRPKHLTVVVGAADGDECLIDMSRVESAWMSNGAINVRMQSGINVHMTPASWDRAVDEGGATE